MSATNLEIKELVLQKPENVSYNIERSVCVRVYFCVDKGSQTFLEMTLAYSTANQSVGC